MANTDLFGPVTVARLALFARLFQLEWIVAMALAAVALAAARGGLWRHRALLVGLAAAVLSIRLALVDFHEDGAQLPYVVQSTCIAFPEAHESYNLCSYRLMGDHKRLGLSALLALGFQVFGGYKAVASSIVLGLSVLNALLLYALTLRALRCRWTALAAGLLYAVHPMAIHFAAATETESPADTFLLLGALLLIWDLERGVAPPQGLARRLAASAPVRALFVAVAFNTRIELLLFLPLFLASALRRRGLAAAGHIAMLLPATALLLLPENPGPIGGFSGANPLSIQVERWGSHVTDYYDMLLGSPASALLLVAGLGLALAGRAGAPSRLLAALTLTVCAVMTVSAAIPPDIKPHGHYLVYRGSILWWPFAALASAALVRWVAASGPATLRVAATRVSVLVLAAVFAVSFASTDTRFPDLRVRWLNPEVGRHRAIAAAVPPGSLLVVSGQCYGSGELAAALYTRGSYRVFEIGAPPCETVRCETVRATVGAARAAGREAFAVGPDEALPCDLLGGPARWAADLRLRPVTAP